MTDEPIPSLAEAMAEIRRLRARVEEVQDILADVYMRTRTSDSKNLPDARLEEEEIKRLRARIAELETAAATTFGTLERPTDDEPARYTHNLPPSAPPHDE